MRKLREGYEPRPEHCDLCHKKVHAKRLCMGHYLKVWRTKPAAGKNMEAIKDAKPGELWALAKEMNLV